MVIVLNFIGYAISLVIVKNWIVCKQFIFIVIIFIMISKLIQIITIVVIIFGSLAAQSETQSTAQLAKCPAYIIPCEAKASTHGPKSTILTFYIQQKSEQEEDFIQMTLTVKQKDTSLKKAIDKATRKVQQIKQSCVEYCNRNKGENCEERVQVENFKVQPSYQIVRREPIFNGFVVTRGVKIVVLQTPSVGQLVDSLLNLGIYQIQQLEWKPNVEADSVQKAIDAGITQAKELCSHINRKIGSILSITQILEEEDGEKTEEEPEGGNSEEQQDQEELSLLKFEVQCIQKTPQQIQAEKKASQADKSGKKKKKNK